MGGEGADFTMPGRLARRGAWQRTGLSPAREAATSDGGQDIAEERVNSAAQQAVAPWNERPGKWSNDPASLAARGDREALSGCR